MTCINDDIKPQTKTFWKGGKRNIESINVTRRFPDLQNSIARKN